MNVDVINEENVYHGGYLNDTYNECKQAMPFIARKCTDLIGCLLIAPLTLYSIASVPLACC